MYTKFLVNVIVSCFISIVCGSSLAGVCASSGECSPFYCSLEDEESITDCHGVINGELTFVPGVNGNAASFDGTSDVDYVGDIFDSPSGSVSLWLEKNSGDQKGGIMEIGHIGAPNSKGIFYSDSDYVYFEIRNADNRHEVVYAPNAISQTTFTHIVAIWDKREDTYHTKLFINGRYVSGQALTGSFTQTHGFMKIGAAGSGDWYGNCEGIIDELRFFNWALSDGEVYAEYVYSSNRYRYQPTGKQVSTGPVKVIGKTLTVNDKPFTVKGIGYQPIPIGSEPSRSTLDYVFADPDIIVRDVNYLTTMNVNTIRFWAELSNHTALLDALENAGMYAIMAFEVPATYIDYSDPGTITYYKNRIIDYVNQFKSHPAVLAWAIGNENNLHYDRDISDWYTLANELARAAYEVEGPNYHPTMVVNGYTLFFGDVNYCSDDVLMNFVDIWGHNAYLRYDYNSYFCYFDKITAKPLIVTEFGVDTYDRDCGCEYQDIQAEWVVHEWDQIKNNCLGGTVMAYSDEWWKCGFHSSHDLCGYFTDVQPDCFSNEEWYGVMAIEDNGALPDIMHPREVYYALQQAFSDRIFCDLDICNNWMYQNVLSATKSRLTSEVSITDDPMSNSSYTYEWEIILPDDVTIAPTITAGGEFNDPCCTFAAPSCNEPNGLSDSGQTFTIRVTVTGADFGNRGIAEAQFGIALLGDVNNDKAVNSTDRGIINAFWRLGAAGSYTFTDCNLNCDTDVNGFDRSIANAVWRGVLGQYSVNAKCPLR